LDEGVNGVSHGHAIFVNPERCGVFPSHDFISLSCSLYVVGSSQEQLFRHDLDLARHLITGDIPIYMAHDSADVWANRQFFSRRKGNPLKIAGGRLFQRDGAVLGQPDLQLESAETNRLQVVD
jgi:hypothetical protein